VFSLLAENQKIVIAVNVSVITVEHSCNEALALIFRNMDLVSRVVFEITETKEIRNPKLVKRFVDAVRLLDGRIAIDDFGAGHFTVDLVTKIKPEFLKLDAVLVADLEGNGDVIVQLCDLVGEYGGRLIAEHVDSKEKLDNLRSLGVHYAQGYYVGKPAPFVLKQDSVSVPSAQVWRVR